MTILRVFPRRTSCTPNDAHAVVGDVPLFLPDDIDEVHISVTFSWDLLEAERLARAYRRIAPVKIGGPATGESGGDFVPGMYLKQGCTITSRGCNNHCWFCLVPRREGKLRELPVQPGNNLLDNNLLACSEQHIRAVFEMLKTQRDVTLTGGLEAKILKPWHVELLADAKVKEAFFAYDTPDDLPPLIEAAKMLKAAGSWYRWRKCGCYVLIGYHGDTIEKAEKRLVTTLKLGYMPFAMFYRDPENKNVKTKEWAQFQRSWTRPAAINAMRRRLGIC